MLTRILKLEVKETSRSSFKDVTSKTWGRNYIESAAKAGLMKGDAQKYFRADAPVTRQELAAVLVQATKVAQTKRNDKMVLQDESCRCMGENAVQSVLGNGWMKTQNGSFLPKQAVKRQEIASVFMEAFILTNCLVSLGQFRTFPSRA